jgi:hypothetical protein
VLRFTVAYAAPGERDLHIDLFDHQGVFIQGSAERVPPGAGIRDMTLSHPLATPGYYFMTVFLTAPGESWTNALAWGPAQPVFLFGPDYGAWMDSKWGTFFSTDFACPLDDADGDGASNDAERIAHTAPRDAADTLRVNMSFADGQMELSWRSALNREYRLFETSDPGAGAWTQVGDAIPGTGDLVRSPLSPQRTAPGRFYRLHVSETPPK